MVRSAFLKSMQIGCLSATLLGLTASASAEVDEARALRQDTARIAGLEDRRELGGGFLLKMLQDPRSAIRARAARALGRIESPDAASALIKALADADEQVRVEAAFALGQIDDAPVQPLVDRLGTEQTAPVRLALVRALGRQGEPAHAPTLSALAQASVADEGIRTAALQGLALISKRSDGRAFPDTVPLAKAGLAAQAAPIQSAAAFVLRSAAPGLKMNADAFDLAAECAASKTLNVDAREDCTQALAGLGEKAVPALTTSATDAHWRVRVAAVDGLGRLKATAALAQVIQGHAEAIKAAEGALAPDQVYPAMQALTAALSLPAEAAKDKALTSAAEALNAAIKVVGRIDAPETGAAALSASHVACRAAAVVDRASGRPRAVRRCGAADYPKAFTEVLTVQVLGTAKPRARMAALRGALKKGTVPGKVAALGALEVDAANEKAQKLIISGLSDADPAVVTEAARVVAAAKIIAGAQPVVDAYHRMMPAKELEAVVTLFKALEVLKPSGADPILEEHQFHPNRAVREAAQAALTAIKGADAKPPARMPIGGAPIEVAPDLARIEVTPYQSATVQTTRGAIKITLAREAAPNTVRNFVRLGRKGFYNNLTFHRVVPGFVVQAGDPRGDGSGGPGYEIRCEIHPQRYIRGAVGMALAGRDTGGSQFFITQGPQPHLDGGYTVFGQVEEGLEVVDALTPGDRILQITFDR